MHVQNSKVPMTISLTKKTLAEGTIYLAEKDTDLARLLETDGVPPLWARKPCFSTLIHIILEQQVSLASAEAMYRRLVKNVTPFSPKHFVERGSSYLRSLGVTRQKAAYCINVAEAILRGRLDLRAVSGMNDSTAANTLIQIKGIGPWTAAIYLLMALRRPDIWPEGDIALINTMCTVKNLDQRPSPSKLSRITDTWRPLRSVAARMFWHHYLSAKT